MVLLWINGCSEPQRDYRKAAPPEVSTVLALDGLWVDLDSAVQAAATEAGMAVVKVDRWQTLVRFELVTEGGQAGELVVVGVRAGANPREGLAAKVGITRGEARVGRFRDAERERLLLTALQRQLREFGAQPHLPASAPAVDGAEGGGAVGNVSGGEAGDAARVLRASGTG